MGGRSGEVVESILELLAPGRPVAVLAEPGMGTTTTLRAAAARLGDPTFVGGGLRSLQDVPFLALTRAVGHDVGRDPATAIEVVVARVGAGVLVLDDLQWADRGTMTGLRELAARVRVLAGLRLGDPGTPAAQAAVVAAGGTHVRLLPLDDATVTSMVQERRPELDPHATAAIVAEAAGNPMVLDHLLARGAVSPTLADALVGALHEVGADGRRLLALLSLAPDGVPARSGGAAAAELLGAGLATDAGAAVVARHRLVAAAAFDALDEDERAVVHREAAALATSDSQRAGHLAAAGDFDAALPLARAAASRASAQERHRLLDLASRCASGTDRLLLAVEAVDAALEAWDRAAARGLAEAASRLPGAADVPAVAASLADARARDGDVDGAHLAAAGVAPTAPDHVRARSMAATATAWAWPGWRPDVATTTAADAHRLFAAQAETARAVADLVAGTPGWTASLGALPQELAPFAALWAGTATGGLPTSGPPHDLELLAAVVELHTTADCDSSAVRLRRALDASGRPIDREVLAAHLSIALADSGRTAAAADVAAVALTGTPTAAGEAFLRWSLVEAEVAGGRLVRAVRAAEELAALPRSPARCLGLVAAGWAAVMAPDPAAPPAIEEPPWPGLAAAHVELQALALRHAGDPAAGERFADAATSWAPWHRRGELRCRWAAADARLRHGDEDAVGDLRGLEEEAVELGQRPLLARIRATMRHAGVRNPPVRGVGRGPLSAREVEVLELVRLGFTTTEAAQALGVAPSTVDTQIESAMRKLDARTRVQAAMAMAGMVP